MLNLRQVLRAVKDAGGTRRFDADGLGMPLQEFQAVVEVLRDADRRGFFEVVTEHQSARTGLVDLVVVQGVTEDGDDYLAAA